MTCRRLEEENLECKNAARNPTMWCVPCLVAFAKGEWGSPPKAMTPEERAVLEAAVEWWKEYNFEPGVFMQHEDEQRYVAAKVALNGAIARMLKARGDKDGR